MLWVVFHVVVFLVLWVDLKVAHKTPHFVPLKEGLAWTVLWICVSCIFGAFIWATQASENASIFFTVYLIEKSLSIDNVFVFLLIFKLLNIPQKYQHRILFWGVFGAIIFRFIFLFAGSALVQEYKWVLYIFGAILLYTGLITLKKEESNHFQVKRYLSILSRYLPIEKKPSYDSLLKKTAEGATLTYSFIALILIEIADVIFAFDSIPAMLAISSDLFLLYTANILSILGLRSLFFVLSDFANRFKYLRYALGVILIFIGIKILISSWWHIPTYFTLSFMVLILGTTFIISRMRQHEL